MQEGCTLDERVLLVRIANEIEFLLGDLTILILEPWILLLVLIKILRIDVTRNGWDVGCSLLSEFVPLNPLEPFMVHDLVDPIDAESNLLVGD